MREEEYRLSLFGREQLRFRYESVGLESLSASEYVERGPLGAALSALMDRASVEDVLRLRASMFKEIVESELDGERKFLLMNVVETYFKLDAEQNKGFRRLLPRKVYAKMQDVESTWADQFEERGRARGREEGREEGRHVGQI